MRLPRPRLRLWHLSALVIVLAPLMAVAARHPTPAIAFAILAQWLALPLWPTVASVRASSRSPGYGQVTPGWVALSLFWIAWYALYLVTYTLLCMAILLAFDDD